MRRTFPPLIVAMLLFSCSDNTSSELKDIEDRAIVTEQPGIRSEITSNILASHFGGFNKGTPTTRANGNFVLSPITDEGDTVFYLAQYADGWELFSADKRSNMIILSSEHGVYDLNEDNTPEQLKFILEENKNFIREVSERDDLELHESWGPYALKKEKFDNGYFSVLNEDMSRAPILQEDLPPGHWELIESRVLDTQTYTSPKLIQTQWGQDQPFNKYTPFKSNDNIKFHAITGCTPVSVAQYEYFTHFKDGVPDKCAATAVLNPDGKTYTFSGESSTIWNFMARYMMESGTDESSLLIGYIGKMLGTIYDNNESHTPIVNCTNFLSSVYGCNYELIDFDFNILSTTIDSGYPMIARADAADSNYGHTFIIDQYKIETMKKKYVYALIRDPLPPGTTNKWKDDLVDENGNIIQYAYTNEVIDLIDSNYVSMNWGNYGQQDKLFYSPEQNWQSDGIEYSYGKKLYKPTR